ncbi:MAG TPA: hypothetical protein VFB42_05265 [Gaiellaceae bacterium]|nr:hypothetical protein [Gaiellaceae bacterium]
MRTMLASTLERCAKASATTRGQTPACCAVRVLAGGGLRTSEALAPRWPAVELGTATLRVLAATTPKAIRAVHLTPPVRETLTLARADPAGLPGCVIATYAPLSPRRASGALRERMMGLEPTTFCMATLSEAPARTTDLP